MRKMIQKNFIIKVLIVLITASAVFIFVYNDADIYNRPIAKVTATEDSGSIQSVTLEMQNGSNEGSVLEIDNRYEPHLVYSERYHRGDMVFLTDDLEHIDGVKRDHWVTASLMLLISSLILFGSRKSLLTLAGIIINVLLFALMIHFYLSGVNILLMTALVSLCFTLVIVISVSGFTRRAFLSFISILVTMAAVSVLSHLLIWHSDIGYDFLDFLPEPYTTSQANCFFMSQIIICCLGAVIDVAITITSVSSELIKKTDGITMKMLISSAGEIADDISGTMINILLMTNVAAIIPVFAVSMSNGINFMTVLRYDAFFDIVRFILGAIAILLSVPVSVFVSSLFLRHGREA